MNSRSTFRARLTLATTLIVAVAVLIVGAVAFSGIRIALETAYETRLETTAKAIRSIVDVRHHVLEDLHNEDLVQFQALLGGGLNAAVYRHDGSLMSSNLTAPPPAAAASIPSASPSGTDVVRVDRGDTVYDVLAIAEKGTRYGTIVVWESRSVFADVERVTLVALGVAGLLVIVAAAIAGGTLSRRMMRPVTDLSAMIAEISTTDLTERMEWKGPDDELARLCDAFDRLLDRLETAFDRERRFIADASHELRTPLSVMRAEVELALMQDRTTDAYRSTLVRLQRETQRLEVLAQNLILTTRDDTTLPPLRPVQARELVERAVTRMEPLAASHRLTLDCEPAPVVVNADEETLERALVALIDNALRFARARVTVRVTADAGGAHFTVSDDGPGFSDAGLREATNRFWRDDPSRSGAGTGLGLAIVRTIVERHHGTIALSNGENGTGAVVVLTLPA